MSLLRGFRHSDLARLLELDQISFPPEIAYSRAELKYFLTHPRCFSLVAEEQVAVPTIAPARGLITGFIVVQRVRHTGDDAGRIITIDVDPAFRRTGLGTLLVTAAEERLRTEAARVLKLEVAENNHAAQLFYTGLGFETTGTIPDYYPGGLQALTMLKTL